MARSPARFLAPLALIAFGVALFLVVTTVLKDDPGTSNTGTPTAAQKQGKGGKGGKKKNKKKATPKTYTVKSGDTPSGIAEKVDVPLDTILELNPELDPQALTPGTELKLR